MKVTYSRSWPGEEVYSHKAAAGQVDFALLRWNWLSPRTGSLLTPPPPFFFFFTQCYTVSPNFPNMVHNENHPRPSDTVCPIIRFLPPLHEILVRDGTHGTQCCPPCILSLRRDSGKNQLWECWWAMYGANLFRPQCLSLCKMGTVMSQA